MARGSWWAAALALSACAGTEAAGPGPSVGTAALEEGQPAYARFVDASIGFEISRPDSEEWQFAPGHEAPEGILVPVVVLHPSTGSQVVVQVTPDVAAPQEFAERLAVGLRSKPGFETTVPASNADGSRSGFSFHLGDEVDGKVGITDTRDGRLFVLLATWPAGSSPQLVAEVDEIMESLRPLKGEPPLRAQNTQP